KRLEVSYGGEPAPQDPALAEAEVLLSGGFDLTRLRERAPRLKWLQSTSAGVENAVAHIPDGVVLTNASGGHGPKGGEYGMTALLMLNHRVPHFATSKQKKSWDQAFAGPIAGKTVLFLGVGAIGSSAAKLAKRFGMKLVGVGRKARQDKLFGRIHAQ